MSKKLRIWLPLFLCAVIILSLSPFAFAEEANNTITFSDEERFNSRESATVNEVLARANELNGQTDWRYNDGQYTYCLLFVSDFWSSTHTFPDGKAGLGFQGSYGWGSAQNYCNNFRISESMDNIPIGADVFFSTGDGLGHIGIYVGNGAFLNAYAQNIRIDTFYDSPYGLGNYWANHYLGWGWHQYVDVQSNFTPDPLLPDGDYIITAAADTRYYLDIEGGAYPAAPGTNVSLYYSPDGRVDDHDAWTVRNNGDGYYRISQYKQNVSLDVEDESNENGANVQVWANNDFAAQQWAISGNSSTGYRLKARCSGKYLEYADSVLASGTRVQQWAYDGGAPAQLWQFIPYKPNHTVSYDANGGINPPPAQTKQQGTTLILSNVIPTRSNVLDGGCTVYFDANGGTVNQPSIAEPFTRQYSFKCWNTAVNGSGTNYTPGAGYVNDENITLYAQWDSMLVAGSITLPTPVREGYTVLGWAETPSATAAKYNAGSPFSTTNSITLYAVWKPADYTVTFDPNGGTVNPVSKSVVYNEAYGMLPVPTKAGCSFDGWYTDALEGTLVTYDTRLTVPADQTLYAHWSPLGEMVMPGFVAAIEEEAFMGDSHISHVEIPESCSSIGSRAFADCKNLVSMRILGKNTTFESDTFADSPNVVIYCYGGSRAQHLASADGLEYHLIGVDSDWVSPDSVPHGAEIIERKWTYTTREYTDSSSASYPGWTKYDSKITSWTGWSGWQNSEISASDDRQVRTQTVVTGYNMISYCVSGPQGRSYQPSPTYSVRLQHGPYWWSKAEFDSARVFYAGSYFDYESNVAGYVLDGTGYCKWDGSDTGGYVPMFIQDTTYGTQWSYRDAVYTYSYYRDVDEESSADPSGQDNVSNIQEWVKYRY